MDIPFGAEDIDLIYTEDPRTAARTAAGIATGTAAGTADNCTADINYTPQGEKVIYITRSGAFINFSDIQILNSNEKVQNNKAEYILALNKIINKIENYFTLTINNIITGKITKRKTCIIDKVKNRIIIPRFGIFEIANAKFGLQNIKVVSQIQRTATNNAIIATATDNPTCPFTWHGKLTHNQEIISEYMLKNIYNKERTESGSASAILNLEAGQGKSYLAAYFISVFKKKTAIILHSTSMIEQWRKVLNACFPGVKIGCYYHKEKTHGDIMIFIINSATKDKIVIEGEELLAGDFHERFGFAIYDECHLYNNSYLGKAFKYLQTQKMIGLSATPDESKTDKLVWWELGPILTANKIPGFQTESVNFKAEVYKIKYAGPPDFTQVIKNEYYDITNTPLTINMLCEDLDRNKIIIDCIIDYMKNNKYLYVFSQRREHLTILMKMLKLAMRSDGETRKDGEARSDCEISRSDGEARSDGETRSDGEPRKDCEISRSDCKIQSDGEPQSDCKITPGLVLDDDDFVRLVGGSKSIDAENAELKANVIFTTYQYGATGRSIIKMNGAVLASPVSSKMKQTIGRILRLGSDVNIVRKIYDIVDVRLKLKSYWPKRKKYYDDMNFKIIEYKNIKIDSPIIKSLNEPPQKIISKSRKKPKQIEAQNLQLNEVPPISQNLQPDISINKITELYSKIIKPLSF
jgi:hypothetical protein